EQTARHAPPWGYNPIFAFPHVAPSHSVVALRSRRERWLPPDCIRGNRATDQRLCSVLAYLLLLSQRHRAGMAHTRARCLPPSAGAPAQHLYDRACRALTLHIGGVCPGGAEKHFAEQDP